MLEWINHFYILRPSKSIIFTPQSNCLLCFVHFNNKNTWSFHPLVNYRPDLDDRREWTSAKMNVVVCFGANFSFLIINGIEIRYYPTEFDLYLHLQCILKVAHTLKRVMRTSTCADLCGNACALLLFFCLFVCLFFVCFFLFFYQKVVKLHTFEKRFNFWIILV